MSTVQYWLSSHRKRKVRHHKTSLVITRQKEIKRDVFPMSTENTAFFHTEKGEIAPHIKLSVWCQQCFLLPHTHTHTEAFYVNWEYCLSPCRKRKDQIHALDGAPVVNCVFSFHIHIHTHTQTHWSVPCQLTILPFLIPKKERSCQLRIQHLFIPKKERAPTHINSSVWCQQCNTGFLHTEKGKIEHAHCLGRLMPTMY